MFIVADAVSIQIDIHIVGMIVVTVVPNPVEAGGL